MEQNLETLAELLKQSPIQGVPLGTNYDQRIQLAQAEQLQGIRKALEAANAFNQAELEAKIRFP